MEPWRVALAQGETEAAWDQFIARYRRLIVATIKRTLERHDDLADVFANVCQALSVDGLARLQRYVDRGQAGPRFSTWLVAVVHNQTVDWLRHRDGRRRLTVPDGLSPLQQQIFRHVFADHHSHAESYELVRAGTAPDLSFGRFLREVTQTYRVVQRTRGRSWIGHFAAPPGGGESAPEVVKDPFAIPETGSRLAGVLDQLPSDIRLAVQLFVVDEMPAGEVARLLGWPNAKAVYNRVYRCLGVLRRELERQGVRPADL